MQLPVNSKRNLTLSITEGLMPVQNFGHLIWRANFGKDHKAGKD